MASFKSTVNHYIEFLVAVAGGGTSAAVHRASKVWISHVAMWIHCMRGLAIPEAHSKQPINDTWACP